MVVDGHARDSMGANEDVFAEFDEWQDETDIILRGDETAREIWLRRGI